MADTGDYKNEEEEEEEDEVEAIDYRSQKDAVLFLIDVSKSMLTPPPPSNEKNAETDSPTAAALKCAYLIMQQRIIASPKDMMGVLLFGTEQTKVKDNSGQETSVYPHCYLITDLDVPSAEDVKTLKEIVENEDEAKSLLAPTKEKISMANLLTCANSLFISRAANFGSRRLFIITDEDDPHNGDKKAKEAAAIRAKDLYDLDVVIELFPISHPDHKFDRTKFYDDIIYRDPIDGDDAALRPADLKSSGDGISLMNNLISDINSKQIPKRTLFSDFPFHIAPGFTISIKGYNVLQRQLPNRSTYVWMNGEVAQVPTGVSTQTNEDTTRPINKEQIQKAYRFGGEQVQFKPEEQKQLKDFGPPGLTIIGFKLQSMLPSWASMNKSTFIYPTDEGFVGSTRVFSSLWEKLLKDNKMGLGWYIARVNANPIIVAILPSAERIDESTKQQVFPAGLWLYPLPFLDDVRNPPPSTSHIMAPDTLVDSMRTIVMQLQLPKGTYDPKKYPNPALQWHYKILQAIALGEEVPDTPEDKTLPSYRQINKRCGEYSLQWKATLEEQYIAYDHEHRNSLKHELKDDEDQGKIKKKAKKETSEGVLEGLSHQELKKLVGRGELEKFKVQELKDWLKGKGLRAEGKKGDLVQRVEEWVEEN